jgi:ABC-type transport system involved in cytochrome bd biosynthesis fused ATPase/permease subunit
MVGNLTDSMYVAREQQQQAQQKTSFSFGSISSIIANVIVTFNVIVIKLIAAQGRSSAIMATLMHVLMATKMTFESMWNGIPGKMIQMLGS